MKKFLGVVFLLCCLLIPQIVSAEKTDWVDKSFNFKAVRRVVLNDLEAETTLGLLGRVQQQKVLGSYLDGAKKLKCEVANDGAGDLYIKCKIKKWKNDYYIIPERTVWEERKQTRRVRYDGYWVNETYYITLPVTYPPRRVDTSDLIVSFEAYDATGKLVFGREDNRTREDREAQLGMFGRMCNSFFSDLDKKIKK